MSRSTIVVAALVKHFLVEHLPVCACTAPCYHSAASSGAALRHLLRILPCDRKTTAAKTPVAIEREEFASYLTSICGVAPATCDRRVQDVGAFLVFDSAGDQLQSAPKGRHTVEPPAPVVPAAILILEMPDPLDYTCACSKPYTASPNCQLQKVTRPT